MRDVDDIFRASDTMAARSAELGLLEQLPGRWEGKGFNLIARPAKQGVATNPTFFLELNGTHETLEFTAIGGDIPNRGDIRAHQTSARHLLSADRSRLRGRLVHS